VSNQDIAALSAEQIEKMREKLGQVSGTYDFPLCIAEAACHIVRAEINIAQAQADAEQAEAVSAAEEAAAREQRMMDAAIYGTGLEKMDAASLIRKDALARYVERAKREERERTVKELLYLGAVNLQDDKELVQDLWRGEFCAEAESDKDVARAVQRLRALAAPRAASRDAAKEGGQ